jgi:hypothetical protein
MVQLRSIQAWPRPLGLRSGDADEVAVAPAHPLADRVRLALTPYGAVLGCIGAPHLQEASQMAFTQRDRPVKTLAP